MENRLWDNDLPLQLERQAEKVNSARAAPGISQR